MFLAYLSSLEVAVVWEVTSVEGNGWGSPFSFWIRNSLRHGHGQLSREIGDIVRVLLSLLFRRLDLISQSKLSQEAKGAFIVSFLI